VIHVIAAANAPQENTVQHFTIGAENNITIHTSRKAARETDAGTFATEEQFADLIGPDNKRLIQIWNGLPGVKAVTKFTSRKTATERIWKAVQSLRDSLPVATAGDEPVAAAPVAPQTPQVAPELPLAKTNATCSKKADVAATKSSGPREGTKTSRVIELLKRENGVTLKELMTEMGWQSHTTRALMSAGGSLAKKHGLTVVSAKGKNGDRSYSTKA
jgi:hypothetical protein